MYEPTRVNTVWSVGLRACVYEPTRVNTVWSVGLRATLQYESKKLEFLRGKEREVSREASRKAEGPFSTQLREVKAELY